MNRRGFVGVTCAGLAGLFFPQKVKAHKKERWGLLPVDRKEHTFVVDLSKADNPFVLLNQGFKKLEDIPSDIFILSGAQTIGDTTTIYHTVGSIRANKKTIDMLKQTVLVDDGKLMGASLVEDSILVDNCVLLATKRLADKRCDHQG